MGLPTADH